MNRFEWDKRIDILEGHTRNKKLELGIRELIYSMNEPEYDEIEREHYRAELLFLKTLIDNGLKNAIG